MPRSALSDDQPFPFHLFSSCTYVPISRVVVCPLAGHHSESANEKMGWNNVSLDYSRLARVILAERRWVLAGGLQSDCKRG